MTIKQFALQEAIYTRLNNDSTLTSTYGASVYDEVPEGSSFPYVSIGETTALDYSTNDVDGSEQTMTLHVWSQYRGTKETKNILDRLHDLLHDYSLSVTGANLINLRFDFSDLFRDPDGITRHGVIRFRAILLGS